jgi:cell division protease FtsH
MRDYKSVIESLKDTLLDQYVLSKDAVFELLEQRRELLPAGPVAPRAAASLTLCEEEDAVAA